MRERHDLFAPPWRRRGRRRRRRGAAADAEGGAPGRAKPAAHWPIREPRSRPARESQGASAAETARLACESLGLGPRPPPSYTAAVSTRSRRAGRGEVLLVGHEPDFSDEVARLTGARVKLRKGGLAIVDGPT